VRAQNAMRTFRNSSVFLDYFFCLCRQRVGFAHIGAVSVKWQPCANASSFIVNLLSARQFKAMPAPGAALPMRCASAAPAQFCLCASSFRESFAGIPTKWRRCGCDEIETLWI